MAVGVVAAVMLPMSVTRGIERAVIGILAEAVCIEFALWFGRPARWRYAVAGVLAALVPLVQLLAMLAVQYGPGALSSFRTILLDKQGGAKLGLAGQAAGTLVGMVVVVSSVYGSVCGILGWSLARRILQRLGREPE